MIYGHVMRSIAQLQWRAACSALERARAHSCMLQLTTAHSAKQHAADCKSRPRTPTSVHVRACFPRQTTWFEVQSVRRLNSTKNSGYVCALLNNTNSE